jgi:hypothetical protein
MPNVGGRCMKSEYRAYTGNPEVLGETCDCASMSTKNLTWTGSGPKPDLRSERPVDYPPEPWHGYTCIFVNALEIWESHDGDYEDGVLASGMRQGIVWYVGTNVSEKCTAYIFRGKVSKQVTVVPVRVGTMGGTKRTGPLRSNRKGECGSQIYGTENCSRPTLGVFLSFGSPESLTDLCYVCLHIVYVL